MLCHRKVGYLNVNIFQMGFWHVNTKWLLICILKTARTNHHSYGDHTSNNNSHVITSNMHLLGILVRKSVTKIFHFFLITSDHQCFFSRGKQIAEMMKSEGLLVIPGIQFYILSSIFQLLWYALNFASFWIGFVQRTYKKDTIINAN